MTLDEWKRTLNVNLDSLFLCCKSVLPEMIRKEYGKIINFSSGTGKQPLSHRVPYATAKMGVIGFTRTLAADVGRYNINVNAICPGGFMTDPNRRWVEEKPEVIEGFKRKVPRGEFGKPEDLVPLAINLASDAARYITGAAILIDGGYTAW